MAHIIPITNGKGSKEMANGSYTVTTTTVGYDESSIDPASIDIEEGVNEYNFTIAATGTLTLHVSDDGSEIGVPIVGATFYRCDSEGNTYGEIVTSDDEGNAVFNYVPYADDGAPTIYYKQISSDGEHTFDDALQNTAMTTDTLTVEIQNSPAVERTFTVTDANYENLPIADGEITLS
ncbi:MAG: hypothetical protein ACI31S_03175 [Bacilli bacterium]